MSNELISQEFVDTVKQKYAHGSDVEKKAIELFAKALLQGDAEADFFYRFSKIDKTTSLPNKEALLEELSAIDKKAMLIILKLKHLESIEKAYGCEDLKDIVLHKSNALKQIIKECEASLYVIGSYKFAILVKEEVYFDKHLSLLNFSILNNIENFLFTADDQKSIMLDFTAGISYGTKDIYHDANTALYQAIHEKESYKVYNDSLESSKLKKVSLDKYRLYKEALHNGYVVPYFQPIIDAKSQKVIKYEALARIELPDGSVIVPKQFLHVAIEDRTFEFFTRQMMQKVFNIYAKCDANISLNVTYENLKSHTMLEYIKNRLERFGGERLTFEIVETEEIKDYKVVEDFTSMIKEYGCKISIDDFGSGYSNFVNLVKLEIDYIKIDGALIERIFTDEKAGLMIKGLVGFAKSTDVKTIAEFVSSHEAAERLREYGVDYLQGYYYGEPKSAQFYDLI